MTTAQQSKTDALKAQLEDELARLIVRHGKIDAHLHNADREVPQDWAERAQLFENDEVLEALDDRTRLRIAQLRAALERFDDPDWGECGRCGEPIGVGRLAAMPTTQVCVRCAEAAEAAKR